jgi:serine protease Do
MTTHTRHKFPLLLLGLAGALACNKPHPERGSRSAPRSNPESSPVQTTEATPAPVNAPSPQEMRALATLPSFAPLVDSVKAAVINVEVHSRAPEPLAASGPSPWPDFFDRFFGQPGRPRSRSRDQIRAGIGSGFIIEPGGIAVTNNHVVDGAISIQVHLNDGRNFDADVLGRDPLTDVAVIKFKGNSPDLPLPKDLPHVQLGDSDAMRVGDWVVAIGNPFGLTSSVSAGIISAKDRVIGAGPYDDFVQTDAAINPGNSGGPLFNLRGEVIGINTAIVGGGSGIGFAVPSNLAKALLPQLEKDGHVTRGWLGIGAQNMTPDLAKALGVPVREGAVVAEVNEGTPAQKAGLKPDDVIVAVDGQPMTSASALTRIVALKPPGTSVLLTLYRGAQKEEAKVVLGTRPDVEGLGGVGGSSNGSAEDEKRQARIGLQYQEVDPSFARFRNAPAEGALITEVAPGSLADTAGLAPGMIVVEAGGKPIKRAGDLTKALRQAKPGSVLLLRVEVEGSKMLRALTIAK